MINNLFVSLIINIIIKIILVHKHNNEDKLKIISYIQLLFISITVTVIEMNKNQYLAQYNI